MSQPDIFPWPEIGKKVSQAIAKAWLEPEGFGQQFQDDPKTTLEGEGIVFPPGIHVTVDQNTSNWLIKPHPDAPQEAIFVIPLPPKPDDVTTEQLNQWVDGQLEHIDSVFPLPPWFVCIC